MRVIVLAMVVAGICGTSVAQHPAQKQHPAQERGCEDSAKTQDELNTCASNRAKQADADLKAAYARLLDAASDDQAAQSKFRTMENAWLRFRDAYLDAAFPAPNKQLSYGTMYPMEYDDLVEGITREQVGRLVRILADYVSSK